jgi:hypothetical protein
MNAIQHRIRNGLNDRNVLNVQNGRSDLNDQNQNIQNCKDHHYLGDRQRNRVTYNLI